MRSEDGQLCLSDDLEIHILELPKFTKSQTELRTPLDGWLYFVNHGQELDAERLPPPLGNPENRLAIGVLTVICLVVRSKHCSSLPMNFSRD